MRSFLVHLFAIPCLVLLLSGCSKEGAPLEPKIKDGAPEVKKLLPTTKGGEEKGPKGPAGVSD